MNDQSKINEQTNQDNSTKKSFSNNSYSYNKTKQERDYFIANPATKADKVTCAETSVNMHHEFSDVFTGFWALQKHFLPTSQ